MNEKTIFEKVIARELPGTFLYEDEEYAVIQSIEPETSFHYLVIPKKAVPGIEMLTNEDLHVPGELIRIAKLVMEKENIRDFKLIFNGGAHRHIHDHLHLHILGGEGLEG